MISVTVANQGLTPFVNLFGKLYHGTLKPEIFLKEFQDKKTSAIRGLLNPEQHPGPFNSTGRLLNFLHRHWQTTQWTYPALINNKSFGMDWPVGNQRFLTSGLTKITPWANFKVLLLDNRNLDVANYLDQYVEINSDQQLTDLLGMTFEQTDFKLELVDDAGQASLQMCYLGEADKQWGYNFDLLKQFLAWRSQYPVPQIKIYTNWPEQITDSSGIWQWSVAGDVTALKRKLFHPGHLENHVRHQHNENLLNRSDQHVLWIVEDRPVDLGNFLFWINNNHSAFCDHAGGLVLYRTADSFSSKDICLGWY